MLRRTVPNRKLEPGEGLPVRPGGRLAKDPASHERPHAKPASEQPEGHSQLGAGGERHQQADGHADQGEDQRAERV